MAKEFDKIDVQKIAEGLGADSAVSQLKTGENGKRYFEIMIVLKTGTENKLVCELTEAEAKDQKLIGKAEGENVFHCLYLGGRYTKDFHKRVCGFRLIEPTMEGAKLGMVFYEATQ